MRVYLPVSWDQLQALTRGGLDLTVGHAVTDDVRAELPEADEEELEYAACGAAAHDAIALVTAGQPRRVVLAADVTAEPVGNLSEVRLSAPVALSDVAAVLVDAEGATGDLADEDLAWYAVQELPALLG